MSSLTCTIIQTALHWENTTANLQMLEEKINGIPGKTEVVILPEMFSTGFSMNPEKFAEDMNGQTVQWMKRIAAQKKVILAGSLMIKENDLFFNRLIWMLPNGQMGVYDKRHLFAYANENNHYTPGNKRLIASVNGWKINLMICYDLRFPVWSRQAPHTSHSIINYEYDILIYVANWPDKRKNAWNTLLAARAIENQCFCVGVNRTGTDGNNIFYSGGSMAVSPVGDIIFQMNDESDTCTFTLQKNDLETIRSSMPFLKDADPFILMQN